MPYFRDTMCSCTSAECASGVQTELTAWMEKMARSGDPSSVPTAAQQTELEATSHEYFACSAKLHDARPSTPGSGTP